MYWYTRNSAKKINSSSLIADAWHHRSDAFSSVGSLVGIGGSIIGFKILDPLAAIVIAIIILKVSYDIGKDAVEKVHNKIEESFSEAKHCMVHVNPQY